MSIFNETEAKEFVDIQFEELKNKNLTQTLFELDIERIGDNFTTALEQQQVLDEEDLRDVLDIYNGTYEPYEFVQAVFINFDDFRKIENKTEML